MSWKTEEKIERSCFEKDLNIVGQILLSVLQKMASDLGSEKKIKNVFNC